LSNAAVQGYALTITDYASRYLIASKRYGRSKNATPFGVFEPAFKTLVSPTPFAATTVGVCVTHALYGLSKLAVRLRLGINLERIKPGHPEQNGRRERMHLTLNARRSSAPRPTSCGNWLASVRAPARARSRVSSHLAQVVVKFLALCRC
jgi:hypothetical protein